MRRYRFIFLAALILVTRSVAAQQTSTPVPQGTALLQQCMAALSGGHPLADVTLSGTAQRIAGSDDEFGTVVLKALATGSSRVDLTLPSGNRSEVLSSSPEPLGAWTGPDGVSHTMTHHNLLTAPGWFFPAFPIASGLSGGYVANYIGHETRNGRAVEHLTVSQVSTIMAPPGVPSLTHLSQVDFFLDSTTFLPAVITFNIHPDENALIDIAIEINFSDYTTVNSAQVPFHIQKFINNSLALDLKVQNVIFNSGLIAHSLS
jgi:hypothetical protein